MDPCSSLTTFSGSIHNPSVTNVKLSQGKKRMSEPHLKGKKLIILTAANTSHNKRIKKEFF